MILSREDAESPRRVTLPRNRSTAKQHFIYLTFQKAMRKILFIPMLFLGGGSLAQAKDSTIQTQPPPTAGKSAEFPGGLEQFYKFLGRNIRYPSKARNKKITGKVIATFIVEPDGSLSTFKIKQSLSTECDDELIRVLKLCPKWIPGIQNGIGVRQQLAIPFTFQLATIRR